MPGHDLVDGIERRPYLHTVPQTIKEFRGKRAEIAALHFLLAVSERGHQGVTFFLEVLIAGAGVEKRYCGKIMASGKMSAEFAVGFFPPAKRLGRRRDSSSQAERMGQAVDRKRMHVTAVCFLGFHARPREKANLLHGKWERLPTDLFTARRCGVAVSRIQNRVLGYGSPKRIRQKHRAGYRARASDKLPACKSLKAGHPFSPPW